jgi:hypothetical protein
LTKPPRERAAFIRTERQRLRRMDARRATTAVNYYPAAERNEPRGVHFTVETGYPSAGTFRLATSKGHILAICTVYSDDEADYRKIHDTLAAILEQKDPA